MKKYPLVICLMITLAAVLLSPTGLYGAVEYTGGTYVQNFDQLADSGKGLPFVDDETLPGWYAMSGASRITYTGQTDVDCALPRKETPHADSYAASAGGGRAVGIYSFGSKKEKADRALGSISDQGKDFWYGLCLKNQSGSALSGFTLSYKGEQWRMAGSPAQHLAVFYRVGGDALDKTGTWIPLKDLAFSSPRTDGVKNLDGNTCAANLSQAVSAGIPAGEKVWIVWMDLDYQGALDHALAIDDVQFAGNVELQVSTENN